MEKTHVKNKSDLDMLRLLFLTSIQLRMIYLLLLQQVINKLKGDNRRQKAMMATNVTNYQVHS